MKKNSKASKTLKYGGAGPFNVFSEYLQHRKVYQSDKEAENLKEYSLEDLDNIKKQILGLENLESKTQTLELLKKKGITNEKQLLALLHKHNLTLYKPPIFRSVKHNIRTEIVDALHKNHAPYNPSSKPIKSSIVSTTSRPLTFARGRATSKKIKFSNS